MTKTRVKAIWDWQPSQKPKASVPLCTKSYCLMTTTRRWISLSLCSEACRQNHCTQLRSVMQEAYVLNFLCALFAGAATLWNEKLLKDLLTCFGYFTFARLSHLHHAGVACTENAGKARRASQSKDLDNSFLQASASGQVALSMFFGG